MEAATTSGSALLTRDGAVPVAPALPKSTPNKASQPIDGVARCSCCERFPLVGELVVLHSSSKRSGWVCESCESAGRGERVGDVVSTARIRSFGGAMNVRRAG